MGALHLLYLYAQFGVAQYNALYAALAVIPMLLVYIELIWTVLLAGMQVTYAIQNIHSLGPPKAVPPATHLLRRRLALALVAEVKALRDQDVAATLSLGAFARTHEIPRQWVDRVAEELQAAEILAVDTDGFARATGTSVSSAWDVVRVIEGGDPEERLELASTVEHSLATARAASRKELSQVDVLGERRSS